MDVAGLPARLEARLARGRSMAAARMLSRCVVWRKTGGYVTNADGAQVPEWAAVYVDLRVRIGSGSSGDGGSRGVTIGSVTFENATGVGHFPVSAELLEDGDLFEVVGGECTGDVYRIVAAIRYDQQTARRLPIEETQSPAEGWAA